ncbi:DNA-processing protein DprA [Capnocytophaga granulosa]
MKYTDNSLNILTALRYKGIGRAWIAKNYKPSISLEKLSLSLNTNEESFMQERNKVEEQIKKLDNCDGIVALGDEDFPKHRGEVKASERPIYLFYKGDIKLLDINNPSVSVIGLLNPDYKIEEREQKLVSEIVKKEITIVSGLAFGCDGIAHKEALNGGKTIAILPSPLDNILPAKHKDLAYEIVEKGGLLITEYYEDFFSSKELITRYKERDRLQALFCDMIVLVASYAQDSATRWNIVDKKLDCGARLAMGYAKDYGIPRAIMYNKDIDAENPMFDLNRQLIEEQKNITILTSKNLDPIITDIKSKKSFKKDLFS